MGVQSDVGELCFDSRSVRNREAVPAFKIHWHHQCYGWRVEFISFTKTKLIFNRIVLEGGKLANVNNGVEIQAAEK